MTRYPFAIKSAIYDALDAEEMKAAEQAVAFLSKFTGREITLDALPDVMQALHPLILCYVAGRELREHGLVLTAEEKYRAERAPSPPPFVDPK